MSIAISLAFYEEPSVAPEVFTSEFFHQLQTIETIEDEDGPETAA
jgi:hypothetical protein